MSWHSKWVFVSVLVAFLFAYVVAGWAGSAKWVKRINALTPMLALLLAYMCADLVIGSLQIDMIRTGSARRALRRSEDPFGFWLFICMASIMVPTFILMAVEAWRNPRTLASMLDDERK